MEHNPVRPTTVIGDSKLGKRLRDKAGIDLVIVSETFQRTHSFKFRAAWQVATNVPENHLITASSGNFGQALALACKLTGKQCTVVMPLTSAETKIEAVQGYGATVDIINLDQISRAERVAELVAEYLGSRAVSPYDDEFVIDGNATLGDEITLLNPLPDVVIAPVGGGGLISGIVTGIIRSAQWVNVIGAEPEMANDAARSLREGRLIANEAEPQTIADGVRTLSLGQRNWEIIRRNVSKIVEVPEEAIGRAVCELLWNADLKVEPTGALSLAALMAHPLERFRDQQVCLVVSGGNVDNGRYKGIIDRYPEF